MKKFILTFLLASAGIAAAGPNDFIFMQRNAADNGNTQRVIASPVTTGFFTYNATTKLGGYTALGSGLSLDGGVLSATSVPGATGPAGAVGANGKSAYELAQQQGYSGTVIAWLASLKGDPGTPGATGATGPAGQSITGPQGAAGAAGANGKSAYELAQVNGFTGTLQAWLASLQGAAGRDGANGATGATGATGPAGAPGTTDYNGIANKPTTLAGFGITDAYPLGSNPAGYVTQASARSAISLTTTGSGATTYNASTGVLNVPMPAAMTVPTINRAVITTATDGTYTWTLPVACATGAIPVVSITPENPSGGAATDVFNHKITARTNASVSILVARTQVSAVSLLGLSILSIPSSGTGAIPVHLIAVCP